MSYAKYDKKTEQYSTKKARPNNQNTQSNLKKIANRLTKEAANNPNIVLNEFQHDFIKKAFEGTSFLKFLGVDVAHHISISVIKDFLVDFMNNPTSYSTKNLNEFSDAFCSTESSEDDKGRTKLKKFFNMGKMANPNPDTLLSQYNSVIKLLNRSTRNLKPGFASVNKSIGANKDEHLLSLKDNKGQYTRSEPAKNISNSISKLSFFNTYCSSTRIVNGQKKILSSSIASVITDSFVTERNNRFTN